jgi:hypothetical protein
MRFHPVPLFGFLTIGLLASCSSGSGSSEDPGIGFQLVIISVQENAVWKINQEIRFTFSEDVDFSTVSNNTINIQTTSGEPATGTFFMRPSEPDTVLFQPNCPTREDLSDAGLRPGGVQYVLTVPGASSNSVNTVRSTANDLLNITQIRHFRTPVEVTPDDAFFDTTLGPPVPLVRSLNSSDMDATYIEFGGDPNNRVYFERRPDQTLVLSAPDFRVPLNLYSDATTQVAVVIEFNQPVNPAGSNLTPDLLSLQYQDAGGVWISLETRVELVQNCTSAGARVRLEPIGVLPANSLLRAVVRPGFEDLTGQTNNLNIDNFADVAMTDEILFSPPVQPEDEVSDEIFEGFLFGGTDPDSLQDLDAAFDVPAADWSEGRLSAAFDFQGTGGPGSNFDWHVGSGEIFFFDTTATVIIGGPDGNPETQQNAVNGIVDVRNLVIEEGGEIRVQGPNAFQVFATGTVEISGRLEVSGFNARNVATLNTGNQVEVGGSGVAGGGRGGNASAVITNSTPRGGVGQGPFGILNAGGLGGESGYAPKGDGKDARRPGGGGGGRFANADDTLSTACNSFDHAGNDGNAGSRGALTGQSPAKGGQPGSGPFVDKDDTNDFLGVLAVPDGPIVIGVPFTGGVQSLVRGELTRMLAGYGGGGGGDAVPFAVFPAPNWNPGSDEKGGPGGGGGGAVHIRALGEIEFGPSGEIFAKGGRGATGENTLFLDHVGGTGGSGSGGHIILESVARIFFNSNSASSDFITAIGGPKVVGPMADIPACNSFGGSGGAGVIQLHVPNALDPVGTSDLTEPNPSDIRVPTLDVGNTVDETLDNIMSPIGKILIPTFGARSRARSKWISLGGASVDPDDPMMTPDLVSFLFQGTGSDGRVLDEDPADGVVDELSNILLAPNGDPISVDDETAPIQSSGLAMIFRGSALNNLLFGETDSVSNDIYLRTPALLKNFILRLQEEGNTANHMDSVVTSATYDEGNPFPSDEVLTINVAVQPDGMSTLLDFTPAMSGTIQVLLIPRFFRVVTDGQPDALPTEAFVNIRFQAARVDGMGNPDEDDPVVDFTGDISQFNTANMAMPGEIQFFRFEVEFDLTGGGGTLDADTKPVTLDFLRIPYLF